MTKKRRLTKAQKVWVEEYLKHGKPKKAALVAYPHQKETSAQFMGTHNLKSMNVQNYMRDLLRKKGLAEDNVAEYLEKVVVAGTSKSALKEAKVSDALRSLEMAARLADLFPIEKKQIQSQNVNVSLKGASDEDLQQTLANLVDEINSFRKMTQRVEEKVVNA